MTTYHRFDPKKSHNNVKLETEQILFSVKILPRIYPSEQGLQHNLQILASPCFGRGVIHYVRSRMRFSENLRKIVYMTR